MCYSSYLQMIEYFQLNIQSSILHLGPSELGRLFFIGFLSGTVAAGLSYHQDGVDNFFFTTLSAFLLLFH